MKRAVLCVVLGFSMYAQGMETQAQEDSTSKRSLKGLLFSYFHTKPVQELDQTRGPHELLAYLPEAKRQELAEKFCADGLTSALAWFIATRSTDSSFDKQWELAIQEVTKDPDVLSTFVAQYFGEPSDSAVKT